MSTNSAVLKLSLAPPLKALITILRKLYVQAGGGRRITALKRGVPPGPILDSVDEVLRILESEGMIGEFGGVIQPVRREAGRAHAILASGNLSQDRIVTRVKALR